MFFVVGISHPRGGNYRVGDGVCTHSVSHAHFLCCTFCLRTRSFSCVHIHAWLKVVKKMFVACVSYLSISPSPFSCFTHLCCSCTLTPASLSCPSSCRTFPSLKRRTRATPHMHRGVWLLGQARCKYREFSLSRSEELSHVRGWIRGNTKIGPVLVHTPWLHTCAGQSLVDACHPLPFACHAVISPRPERDMRDGAPPEGSFTEHGNQYTLRCFSSLAALEPFTHVLRYSPLEPGNIA